MRTSAGLAIFAVSVAIPGFAQSDESNDPQSPPTVSNSATVPPETSTALTTGDPQAGPPEGSGPVGVPDPVPAVVPQPSWSNPDGSNSAKAASLPSQVSGPQESAQGVSGQGAGSGLVDVGGVNGADAPGGLSD